MSDESPSRISISRDALRAELAEMELRLRIYFDEQLKHKASAAELDETVSRVSKIERGEFTAAHAQAVLHIFDAEYRRRAEDGWMPRQRLFMIMSSTAVTISVAMSLLLAFHTGRL